MIQKRAADFLHSLGLGKIETIVYLDLIDNGHSSVLDVSKRAQIHRSNVYDAIRRLIERGFVVELNKGEGKLFRARNPEQIMEYINQKKDEAERVIENLKVRYGEEKQEEGISYSKGILSIRRALHNTVNQDSPISVLATTADLDIVLGESFMNEFNEIRIKRKVPMKLIGFIDQKRLTSLNKKPYTEFRLLKEEGETHISTMIFGDTTMLLQYKKGFAVTEIKNKAIADSFMKYFNKLWKCAKP